MALRLQAITRLGVVSAPRHLSSIDAFATPQTQNAPAPCSKEQESAAVASALDVRSGAAVAAPEEHGGAAVVPALEHGGAGVSPTQEGQSDAAVADGQFGAVGAAVADGQGGAVGAGVADGQGGAVGAGVADGRGGAARPGGSGGAASAGVVGGATERGRKLSVVPAVAGATHTVAAPGQPDGARASLKTVDTTSSDTALTNTTSADATSADATSSTTPAHTTSAGTTSSTTPAHTTSAGTTSTHATSSATSAHAVSGGSSVVAGRGFGDREGGVPVLPEVGVWGARMAQAVSEVLAGDRPISQLVRFTDDVVFMELNRRVRMLGLNSTAGMRGAKEKSTVRSVRVFMPEPCIAEVAAHVRHGERSRAVAFRLEVRRNRWVCTALELG
ncbi:Rv3235 family protein [Kribbella sp. NPDC055110]